MAIYADQSSLAFIEKELYGPQVVENLTFRDNPFFAMVQKYENFVGKSMPIPIIVSPGQGTSNTFSNAQGNQTASNGQEFQLTRKNVYALTTIDNATWEAADSDMGAFLTAAKVEIDSAFMNITNTIANQLYRGGTGTIGQVSAAGLTTGVITLTQPADARAFSVGMTLQAKATDTGTPVAALGYVISVDIASGTVTVSDTAQGGNAGTPSGWAASYYLNVQGDANVAWMGLAGWIPSSAPTGGDSFFGVNRSSNPTMLAGLRFDGTSFSPLEAVNACANQLSNIGGRPTHLFTNYATYTALQNELMGKAVTDMTWEHPAGISFTGMKINGPKGPIVIFSDPNCQPYTAWMLQLDTWTLNTLKKAPRFLTYGENLDSLRVYNADAREIRIGGYGNLGCNAPGWNARLSMSA